jgi:hypothetical protein
MNRRGFLSGLFAAVAVVASPLKSIAQPLIMHYKGKQIIDAVVVYCPYIPLHFKNLPESFVPPLSFGTRYGGVNETTS